jgi:hypothetical protein
MTFHFHKDMPRCVSFPIELTVTHRGDAGPRSELQSKWVVSFHWQWDNLELTKDYRCCSDKVRKLILIPWNPCTSSELFSVATLVLFVKYINVKTGPSGDKSLTGKGRLVTYYWVNSFHSVRPGPKIDILHDENGRHMLAVYWRKLDH